MPPLAEIALAAGFSDQSHFANTFKRHTKHVAGGIPKPRCVRKARFQPNARIVQDDDVPTTLNCRDVIEESLRGRSVANTGIVGHSSRNSFNAPNRVIGKGDHSFARASICSLMVLFGSLVTSRRR